MLNELRFIPLRSFLPLSLRSSFLGLKGGKAGRCAKSSLPTFLPFALSFCLWVFMVDFRPQRRYDGKMREEFPSNMCFLCAPFCLWVFVARILRLKGGKTERCAKSSLPTCVSFALLSAFESSCPGFYASKAVRREDARRVTARTASTFFFLCPPFCHWAFVADFRHIGDKSGRCAKSSLPTFLSFALLFNFEPSWLGFWASKPISREDARAFVARIVGLAITPFTSVASPSVPLRVQRRKIRFLTFAHLLVLVSLWPH